MSTAPASPGARPASPVGDDISSLSGSLQKDLISALIATPIAFREAEDANPVIHPTPNMILLDDSKLVEDSPGPLLASHKVLCAKYMHMASLSTSDLSRTF